MADESPGPATDDGLARELTVHGPTGWERVDAVFAMTVAAELGHLVYSIGDRVESMDPPEQMLAHVRRLRTAAAESSAGPWWRMLVVLTNSGVLRVDYDYGEEPFPAGQLFTPEIYRADLAAFPRAEVPVWLAAYIGHDDRQRRTPKQAAAQARSDRTDNVWATLAENEFPPFPLMWARWATLAAAFTAVGSEWGPRMLPWTGVFEGVARGGATLYALPAGRAVLSGGVWNAPTLDAAYNGGAPLPNLYAGAPDWVADPVLNARAGTGLLSFCYWWEAGRWYRGQSPSAQHCATAVPGIWTADTVAEIIAGVAADAGHGERRAAASALVSAAEAGSVSPEALIDVFGTGGDIDEARYQLALAGLVPPAPDPLPAEAAIARVRDYITGRQLNTAGYPLSQLIAKRFSVGWMVYVPAPEEELAIGRAIFYLADDGVLEHSSSSIAPARYIAGFEQRFSARQGEIA
ncbi:hypothetical protein K7711_40200 [Nocardia sp. CA2R105]|uniref:hypothetical protein n=1 Tax=Nocardia coffeae TaxID=2873381 RepID=UPI001CA6D4E9|nr:hypothetical protein [Nocardia coffeae]MBY8862747.1 hypothetical protein [Nocardia coffeae]